MIAWQRQLVESFGRWRLAPPSTLDVLLALLDSRPEIAMAFEVQGVTADRVRAEGKRISG
jgi:hypothetical protein